MINNYFTRLYTRYLLIFISINLSYQSNSQLIIANQGAPAATILSGFIGTGLTITNPVITCPTVSYGTFSGGTGIGVTNGIVLTNGTASQLSNPESFTMNTPTSAATCSDPQLIALDPAAIHDCCILEFDVVPSCNQLTVRFVFGSEEYPDWVGSSFNDAFGFFVTGPNPAGGNYTNKNIAIVTGTTICSINNVNSGANAAFYVDNTGGMILPFGGYTTAITSNLTVTPCQSYHFKMAIADAGDEALDSGVLIDFLSCANTISASTTATAASCGQNNGTATCVALNGMGTLSYTWSPAPGGGQGTPNATGLVGGTAYTCTVDDIYACILPVTSTVTVPGAASGPTVTNTPLVQTVCSGNTSTSVVLTGSIAGTTFSWTATPTLGITGFTTSGTSTIPVQTLLNSGTTAGTVTYVITPTAAGCPGTPVNYVITVNPQVTPTFTALGTLCQNASAPTLVLTSTNTTPISGTWSPSTVSTATLGTTTYTFTPAIGQCAIPTTLNVIISTPVTPTFAAIANVCQNDLAPTLPVISTNTIPGSWAPAVSTATVGTATYTFTPTPGQCAVNTTINVTVGQLITPTFNAVANVCQGSLAVQLPASSTNTPAITGAWSPLVSTASLGSTTYTFTPDAGQCASNTTLSSIVDPSIIPTFPAIATVCLNNPAPTLLGTSTNGITGAWLPVVSTATAGTTTYTFTPVAGQCASNTTLDITVSTLITPLFTPINPICVGSTVPVLQLTSNNIPPITGTWSPAVDISTAGTTTYSFTSNNGQCASNSTLNIVVNPLPILVVNNPASICAPAIVDLTSTSITLGSSGGTISYCTSSTGLTPLPNPSNISITGTYFIINETNLGCKVILPVVVEIYAKPIAKFAPEPSILNTYNLSSTMNNNSINGVSYEWFFMDGTTSTLDNPTHIFPDSTYGDQTILLITTSINGCKDTTIKAITIEEELIIYIPNTFTPDNDNFNPTFQPVFTSGYDPQDYTLLIFDRWGEIVFESHDTSIGWNGKFGDSNKVQDGVYTWKIEFKLSKKDEHRMLVGMVNLLR